jgi:phosphatidylserine synthase
VSDTSANLAETVRSSCVRGIRWCQQTIGRRPSGADVLSLVALVFALTSAFTISLGEPNFGLVLMFAAYGFDKLDGYYARRFGCASDAGRTLDSFVDVFIYLVTGALLFHVTMSPTVAVSLAVGALLITCGCLRLVRFNDEGFQTDGDRSFYRGLTVVHANLTVVVNYFLVTFVPRWNGWFAAAVIAVVAPLMLSDYRSYKTWRRQVLVAIFAVIAVSLALYIEFG